MYKWLLCWRYLLTRYLALACIISVTLGVATLIVVNSVMSGFSTKLQDRLHGLLSDVVVESTQLNGVQDPEAKMKMIRESAVGDKIQSMTATLEVFAMIQFKLPGLSDEMLTRPIRLIGVEPEGRAAVGGFDGYIKDENGDPVAPNFLLSDKLRDRVVNRQRRVVHPAQPLVPGEPPPPDPPEERIKIPHGAIIGKAIASYRDRKADGDVKDRFMLHRGDDVIITTVSGGKLAPVYDRFVVCSYFQSEMSEYDSQYVFVPLKHLQKLRAMEDRVTSIQIKLKDYNDAALVTETLQTMFPRELFSVATWEDKQGPLLAAISIEKGILNVLLFMIVGVAGFGILAIFVMIVVEKTRDIGILKALGASNTGVMKIFLGYGLLLGIVGSLFGTGLGVLFTNNINWIETQLTMLTGQPIFDRTVYYFNEIPTYTSPWMLVVVNIGAVLIAVMSAVLPALRAALLHPVRALRYE